MPTPDPASELELRFSGIRTGSTLSAAAGMCGGGGIAAFEAFGPRGDGARGDLSLISVESFRPLRSRAINPRRRGGAEVGVPGLEDDADSSRVGVAGDRASEEVGTDLGRSGEDGVRVLGFACA